MNFSCSAVLKLLSPSCIWIDLYTGLVTSHTGLWKTSVYWVMQVFHILTHFITQYQEKILVNITTDLIREVVKYTFLKVCLRSCRAHGGRHKFSKNPKFFLKARILSLATNTASHFSWSDKLTLFFFWENICQIFKSR